MFRCAFLSHFKVQPGTSILNLHANVIQSFQHVTRVWRWFLFFALAPVLYKFVATHCWKVGTLRHCRQLLGGDNIKSSSGTIGLSSLHSKNYFFFNLIFDRLAVTPTNGNPIQSCDPSVRVRGCVDFQAARNKASLPALDAKHSPLPQNQPFQD